MIPEQTRATLPKIASNLPLLPDYRVCTRLARLRRAHPRDLAEIHPRGV
jgi:hypothetical protein